MLAASKMTGLDHIGGGVASLNSDSDSKRSSTSSEEMLSTPKILPESAHFLVKSSGPFGPSNATENNQRDGETMLTTPVLTTPKTLEGWPSPSHLRMTFGSSSPNLRWVYQEWFYMQWHLKRCIKYPSHIKTKRECAIIFMSLYFYIWLHWFLLLSTPVPFSFWTQM